MSAPTPIVLYVGTERPDLVAALAAAGFGLRSSDETEIAAGMTGGEVLIMAFDDHEDPLGLLARIWCAEPDLAIITLDDGDHDLAQAALRIGVAATLAPPHRPQEVALTVRHAWQRRDAGALRFGRDLARTMSSVAAICGAAENRTFLQPVLDEVAKLFASERCSIMLIDESEETPTLGLVAQRGLKADPKKVRVVVGTGISGRVAADGIPQLLLRSADVSSRFSDVAPDQAIAASLCVPIRAAKERGPGSRKAAIHGVINLARTGHQDVFTPLDLEISEFIAALIGQTLSRVDLDAAQAELQRKMAATEKLAYAGEVAAGIAHEVASPIGYLRANIKVLAEYAEDLAPILEELRQTRDDPIIAEVADDLPCLIDECRTGIERATCIVQDMKAMVRVDAKDQPKVPVDIPAMVKGALHLLRPRLADRCRVDLKMDDDLVVLGNEIELSQVLVNLVVNGFDACCARAEEEEGHAPCITVRASAQGELCVLSVTDNGTGISARDQARIFAPLFTTKPSGVGTGLGLGIVKRIVTAHEGTIELKSTLGEGTTFRLLLPMTTTLKIDTSNDRAQERPSTSAV